MAQEQLDKFLELPDDENQTKFRWDLEIFNRIYRNDHFSFTLDLLYMDFK